LITKDIRVIFLQSVAKILCSCSLGSCEFRGLPGFPA
jgi:hypothetical protein